MLGTKVLHATHRSRYRLFCVNSHKAHYELMMPSNGVCLALMWFMRPHKGGQTTPAIITVLPCVLGLSACSTLMVTSTWIDAAADRRRRRPRRLGRPQPHRLALCARHESDACLVVSRVDRPFPSWRQPTKGKGKGEATPPQPSLAPMKAGAEEGRRAAICRSRCTAGLLLP